MKKYENNLICGRIYNLEKNTFLGRKIFGRFASKTYWWRLRNCWMNTKLDLERVAPTAPKLLGEELNIPVLSAKISEITWFVKSSKPAGVLVFWSNYSRKKSLIYSHPQSVNVHPSLCLNIVVQAQSSAILNGDEKKPAFHQTKLSKEMDGMMFIHWRRNWAFENRKPKRL